MATLLVSRLRSPKSDAYLLSMETSSPLSLEDEIRTADCPLCPLARVGLSSALKGMLNQMPRRSEYIFCTTTGVKFTSRHFGKQWQAAYRKAGLGNVDLHFHDLRGTAVVLLAEAGCTIPQIAAITKHSLQTVTAILEKYLTRTRHLASTAICLFEASPTAGFANRLQTGPQKTQISEPKDK